MEVVASGTATTSAEVLFLEFAMRRSAPRTAGILGSGIEQVYTLGVDLRSSFLLRMGSSTEAAFSPGPHVLWKWR